MRTPRLLYALSVDGMGTESATSVTAKGAPFGAVLITWGLVVFLILSGGFDFLLLLSSLMTALTVIGLVVAVFYRRKRDPHAERPFQAKAFPLTGIIAAVGWIILTIILCIASPEATLYAAGLIAVSVPAFLWMKSHRRIDVSIG